MPAERKDYGRGRRKHASAKVFKFKQFLSFKNGIMIGDQSVIPAVQGMQESLNDS